MAESESGETMKKVDMEAWGKHLAGEDAEEALEPGEEEFVEETPVQAQAPRKKPVPQPEVSPEVAAARKVMDQIARERAAKEASRMARGLPRNKHGDRLRQEPIRAPIQVHRTRYLPDHTRLDQLPGEVVIKPGWVPRWVRTYNEQNKETGMRVQEFQHYDYEPVRYTSGEKKGQVVKEALGVLMQGPGDGYMERCVHRSPEGVYDYSYFVEQQQEFVDEINREKEYEMATLVVGKDHGSRRTLANSDDD